MTAWLLDSCEESSMNLIREAKKFHWTMTQKCTLDDMYCLRSPFPLFEWRYRSRSLHSTFDSANAKSWSKISLCWHLGHGNTAVLVQTSYTAFYVQSTQFYNLGNICKGLFFSTSFPGTRREHFFSGNNKLFLYTGSVSKTSSALDICTRKSFQICFSKSRQEQVTFDSGRVQNLLSHSCLWQEKQTIKLLQNSNKIKDLFILVFSF